MKDCFQMNMTAEQLGAGEEGDGASVSEAGEAVRP